MIASDVRIDVRGERADRRMRAHAMMRPKTTDYFTYPIEYGDWYRTTIV